MRAHRFDRVNHLFDYTIDVSIRRIFIRLIQPERGEMLRVIDDSTGDNLDV